MQNPRWEHFAHEADVGVRGLGPSLDDAFAQAARALTAVVTDPDAVEPREAVALRCAEPGAEIEIEVLLNDWLNAVIYEMATRRMVFGRYEVHVDQAAGTLAATAWGEPVDRQRHAPAAEVKGATFTALRVARTGDGWLAQCVVDV
ncbi:MAG TPA: archease [Haliangium sp.]|nr:archease [Haliangium sp.]